MNHLRHIPGVHVEVNAELNDTTEEVTTQREAGPERHGAARSRNRRRSSTQNAGATAGQPGHTFARARTGRVADRSRRRTRTKPQSKLTETDNIVGSDEQPHRRRPATRRAKFGPRSRFRARTSRTFGRVATRPPPSRRSRKISRPVEDEVVGEQSRTSSSRCCDCKPTRARTTYKYVQRGGARFAAGADDRAAVDGEQGHGLDRPVVEHAGDAGRGDVQPAGAALRREERAAERRSDGAAAAGPALTLHADEPAPARSQTTPTEPATIARGCV